MENLNQLLEYVDCHFEEMYNDLKEICSYRSVKGDEEGLDKTRDFLIKKMKSLDFNYHLYPIESGNAIIFGEKKGEKQNTVLFYNHYDVVEEGKKENWKTQTPFDLKIIDNKMYARGISDNKGAFLSRIHAIETILAVNKTLPINVKFILEGDEETGSPSMYKFLNENFDEFKKISKSDVCIWENGCHSIDGQPWVRFGVRGSCSFELKVTTASKDVHGRMGATIPSASWRLIWALSTLKDINEKILIEGFYDSIVPPTKEDLKVLQDFPYDEENLKKLLNLKNFLLDATGEELKKRIYLEPSLSICGLEAGEMYNGPRGIVPHTATARISFYLVAGQTPEAVFCMLKKHLIKHGFSDIEISMKGNGNIPVKTPINIPIKNQLFNSATKVYNKPLIIELTQLGGGPASVFKKMWTELPIVGIGPANINSNHHAPDENLRIDDYKAAVKHIITLLYSY